MIIIIFLIIVLFPVDSMATNSALNRSQKEYVILLHGIARSSKNMDKLAMFLQNNNYDIVNINYPSTKYGMSDLSELITNKINSIIDKKRKVNFVGFSLGGVLIRAILKDRESFPNLGRVVQIAPPNHGSELVDILKRFWLFRKIFGLSGIQLSTDQTEILDLFGEVYYDLGIIAGMNSIAPISSLIIPGIDDGKVSVESTKLNGMKDHIVISSSHIFFPKNKKTHMQVLSFLKTGNFE